MDARAHRLTSVLASAADRAWCFPLLAAVVAATLLASDTFCRHSLRAPVDEEADMMCLFAMEADLGHTPRAAAPRDARPDTV
jgi:hypothetical protein